MSRDNYCYMCDTEVEEFIKTDRTTVIGSFRVKGKMTDSKELPLYKCPNCGVYFTQLGEGE